jgi:hypothetical protein
LYEGNSDVSFADVNLREAQIRGHHNPGKGGWPTVRYFNEATGYEGASYEKKTSKAMCEELGNEKYMREYVEEAGSTSLCSVKTGQGCSDKEQTYMGKWKEKPLDEVKSQMTRLENMDSGKMAPHLKAWIGQRLAILKQLEKVSTHDEL